MSAARAGRGALPLAAVRGVVSLVAVLALVLVVPATARAQAPADSAAGVMPPPAGAAAPPQAADLDVPEIAPGDTAPGDRRLPVSPKPSVHQYRLSLGGGGFSWEEEAGVDDGGFVQLDLERDVLTVLAIRAGLAYGTTEVATTDTEGRPLQPVDARLFLPELSALLQADVGPFRDGPFVPYALVGFGSLVTDPDLEGQNARSQNAFAYGLGGRVSLPGRLGVRGELRRHLVKIEDALGAGRESRSVHTTRLGASLTYAF